MTTDESEAQKKLLENAFLREQHRRKQLAESITRHIPTGQDYSHASIPMPVLNEVLTELRRPLCPTCFTTKIIGHAPDIGRAICWNGHSFDV